MISGPPRAGREKVLGAVLILIVLIAVADHAAGRRASLGLLYVLPVVIAATVLTPPGIIALAVLCSILRAWFDIPVPMLESFLRVPFAMIAYAGSGLFVAGLIRSRAASLELLAGLRHEQHLRREVEEELNILVESSPAAIVTVDAGGLVLAANKAATELLMLPAGEPLKGRPIGIYLPVLADALQVDPGPDGLRTAAQCQGFRENGEVFLANTWFSSWTSPEGKRLAAIIVDSSEEMRDREEENLRQLMRANQIAATAISHEVRNLCGAISVVSANLRARSLDGTASTGPDEDVQALTSLVSGLERIASVELLPRGQDALEEVPLKVVLDDLRIVIEPQWREMGGAIHWKLSPSLPRVLGERHGLLQVFLNLSQNSQRAVQNCTSKQLSISVMPGPVTPEGQNVCVRFADSGPGVSAPERLFAPFQPGADGTGVGLYLSRALIRGYGGDLRWEQAGAESWFTVQLQRTEEKNENGNS